MMKKLLLLVGFAFLGLSTTNAQQAEIGPFLPQTQNNNRALFDVEFISDIGFEIGANGQAGVVFIESLNQYWISAWQSDVINVLDADGLFVDSFAIPGVTGTRAMTTDGTLVYHGTAALQIFAVDPATRTLMSTINITGAGTAEARMCTYDASLDGGAGGFWIGDFASDIASIDMTGSSLLVIPAATHGQAIYGGAFDNVSPGGPFLWIHSQNGTAPNRDTVVQLALPSGTPTGVVYDFSVDGGAQGATEVLAGGLFISDATTASGDTALIGVCQCTPSNLLFGVELVESLGVSDNELSNVSLFPNPATSGVVTVKTLTLGDIQVVVFDILGKKMINTTISNNELNVSSLKQGVYMVKISQNGVSATKKLVIK